MRKRLLITLGCSITEGVGCYDYSINPERLTYHILPEPVRTQTLERFHKLGWPNLLGQELGFDRVLNLGCGGSGNSTHLKFFVDKVLCQIEDLKETYDLFLIWMMTEPTRFSFYSEKEILLFNPGIAGLFPYKTLENAYLNDMPEIKIGPLREQVFLMKVAENLFKALNIKFIFTSWVINFPAIYSFFRSPNLLSPAPSAIVPSRDPRLVCYVDTHPNELGYQYIASQIKEKIIKFHPHFIAKDKPEKFEWEWAGNTDYIMERLPESKTLF